jgi:hypothetical protein
MAAEGLPISGLSKEYFRRRQRSLSKISSAGQFNIF